MVTIDPLRWTQSRRDRDSVSVLTWHGFATPSGVVWGPDARSHSTDAPPDYRCDVVLPAPIIGSPSEIRSDIARALRLHAASLGLGEAGESDD